MTLEDGDEITFVASARDEYPEKKAHSFEALKLIVIGPEKHAEMIRSQMDAVIAEISEIARNQEALQLRLYLQRKKLGGAKNLNLTLQKELTSII